MFKINGHQYKHPSKLGGITATMVDSGRNANGVLQGQKVGRDQYKLNSLEWYQLTVAEWAEILQEFSDFTVDVTFFDPASAAWVTRKMYPGDRSQEYPLGGQFYNSDGSPKIWRNCKVNIIDTGL